MLLEIKFEKDRNRSVALLDGKQVGVCVYEVSGKIWNIVSTRVQDEYAGQGIARKLVERVLAEAEAAGATVEASCSYAVDMLGIKKDPTKPAQCRLIFEEADPS